MSVEMNRRAFTIVGIDSGALVFDSFPAAIRYLKLHLGVGEDWTADDIPAGMPNSYKEGVDREPYSPGKPETFRIELKDRLGGSKEFTFKAYTVVGDEAVESAFRWQASLS